MEIGEIKPTTIALQMANSSVTYPRGIVEDVLVKVDKFVFPADFVVLDMEEDKNVPLILGRSFLVTGKTLIDVQRGELILRTNDEKIVFSIYEAMKHHEETMEVEECKMMELCESPLGAPHLLLLGRTLSITSSQTLSFLFVTFMMHVMSYLTMLPCWIRCRMFLKRE